MKAFIALVMSGVAIMLAPRIQTTGTPGAGYTWSLGDLAADSARLDIEWDHSEWADAYDTEAELTASPISWGTYTFADGVDGIACAAGGSGNSSDEADIAAIFAAQCTTDVDGAGSAPLVCNKVFKIPANCTLDVMAGGTNDASSPAIYLPYSHYAIIGEDVDTSIIYANDTVATNAEGKGPALGNHNSWPNRRGSNGSTYAWDAGDTAAKGQTTILINGTCSGLDYDTDGDATDESSIISILGADADGGPLRYQTRIAGKDATEPHCTITLTDPLPTDFASHTSVTELGANATRYNIFLNFTIGFPYIADGICTVEPPVETSCAPTFKFFGADNVLFDGMKIGPYGNGPIALYSAYKVVTRHSTIGPGQHSKRRGTHSAAISSNDGGSLQSTYDNIYLGGAIRLNLYSNSAPFSYVGYNYWIDQAPDGAGETGSYCTGVTGALGFPWTGHSERNVFINHDTSGNVISAPDGGAAGVGHFLIEANDFACNFLDGLENQGTRRYGTVYRNRVLGDAPSFSISGTNSSQYYNIFANRANSWSFGTNDANNVVGRWNIEEDGSHSAPSAIGVTWPTSSTGKNYAESASTPHDDYATTDLPPSLGFRVNTAPSWWCTQSGDWDGTWSFGYGDGGDNGGTPRKLPAQIRYEGTTCTPP